MYLCHWIVHSQFISYHFPPFVSTAATVAFSDSPSILQPQSICICCSVHLEHTSPLNFHRVSLITFFRSLHWLAYVWNSTLFPILSIPQILLYNSIVLHVTYFPLTYIFIGFLMYVPVLEYMFPWNKIEYKLLLYPYYLAKCLVHGRCSINIWWMN